MLVCLRKLKELIFQPHHLYSILNPPPQISVCAINKTSKQSKTNKQKKTKISSENNYPRGKAEV